MQSAFLGIPMWESMGTALILGDRKSTHQHILFPGLVLGHHHDVAGAAKPLLLQDHPVPLLHRQHVGLAGRRDGDPLCPLFKVAPTRVVPAVEQQFLDEPGWYLGRLPGLLPGCTRCKSDCTGSTHSTCCRCSSL